MSTARLEAFSDGVIAVAITLLVLDLRVPAHAHHTLVHALVEEWPSYAAYAVSFMTIGIIWINHHVMIGRLREPDHMIMMLNLALLMTIGVLPFATDLMAAYLRAGRGQDLAAGVYSGAFLVMGVAFATLNRHILMSKTHLLRDELPLARRRFILRRSISGVIPYLIATGLAAVSPYLSLGICGAVAAYYATPLGSGSESCSGS